MKPLFEKRPRNFGTGWDIQPSRDLTCFVKCPRASDQAAGTEGCPLEWLRVRLLAQRAVL